MSDIFVMPKLNGCKWYEFKYKWALKKTIEFGKTQEAYDYAERFDLSDVEMNTWMNKHYEMWVNRWEYRMQTLRDFVLIITLILTMISTLNIKKSNVERSMEDRYRLPGVGSYR